MNPWPLPKTGVCKTDLIAKISSHDILIIIEILSFEKGYILKQTYSDEKLQSQIDNLERSIENLVRKHDHWFDCGFAKFLDYVDAEPVYPSVISIMYFEGPLCSIFNGEVDDEIFLSEFRDLLESYGFEYDLESRCQLNIYSTCPNLEKEYRQYFRWQWICQLIVPDCSDIYSELYAHFARKPEDLQKLHWREYETLLFRIFQNQGFTAELGPGRGDGGVDIKLLHRDPLGDILTFVQAKKYAPHRQIDLTAVQALYGVTVLDEANQGIFVTTSSYAPVTKKFAARTSNKIILKDSSDVSEWCRVAQTSVIADKSKLVTPSNVEKLLLSLNANKDNRIVTASYGYNMTFNNFAVVIKETKYAALLMSICSKVVFQDWSGQEGAEVPDINSNSIKNLSENTVWRVKRNVSEQGEISYWDGKDLYSPWDGNPKRFNYCD